MTANLSASRRNEKCTTRIHTTEARLRNRILVREEVAIGCDARGDRGLDPRAARRLERHVTEQRGRALELAAQPERLVARPEWRAHCGVVGVEREQRAEIRLEPGGERGGVAER